MIEPIRVETRLQVSCRGGDCPATVVSDPVDRVTPELVRRFREAAMRQGWIFVESPAAPTVHLCPYHAVAWLRRGP